MIIKGREINMKRYCESYEKNIDKDGKLIDEFCKHYNGSKYCLESCAYKCKKIEKQ